jgi:tetratricopeptide (TPR) repeat protein
MRVRFRNDRAMIISESSVFRRVLLQMPYTISLMSRLSFRPSLSKLALAVALAGASLFFALSAAAQQPTHEEEQLRKRMKEMQERALKAAAQGRKPVLPSQIRPTDAEQALYQYLISEIAGQRGRSGIAVQGLTDLAKKTRDPRVARRALEIAFQARQLGDAMEVASLWVELEPDSPVARQAMSVLVANHGSLDSATQSLKQLLGEKERAPALYMQANQLLNRFPDKAAVLKAVRELALLHPDMPQAHLAVAQAAAVAKDYPLALEEARAASKIDPKFQAAVVLQGQVLRETDESRSLDFYREYLAAHPDAGEVRLSYARGLVASKSYLAARQEFAALEKIQPGDPEMPYAIGLIALQMSDYEGADQAFRRTLSLNLRDRNPVLLNLGQLEEARKNWEAAIEWYQQITGNDYFVNAKLRVAGVLAKQRGMDQGRKFLQDVEAESSEQRVQLVLAEAQLLRDAKAQREAHTLLTEWLAKFPDSVELLYDRAMIAEKLDDIPGLERDLRRVIELKPDHAHAFNALGYTLADRTPRLEEARELIEKALKLSPEDAFIMDSLGWVQFRLGKVDESLQTLKKAYAKRSDPEIAAHLGEVMWAAGKRDEAAKLWRAALLEHPDNDSLTAMVKKYRP